MSLSSSDPQGLDSTRYCGTGFFLIGKRNRPLLVEIRPFGGAGCKNSLSGGPFISSIRFRGQAQVLMQRSKFVLTNDSSSLKYSHGAVHKLYSWVFTGPDMRIGHTVSLV